MFSDFWKIHWRVFLVNVIWVTLMSGSLTVATWQVGQVHILALLMMIAAILVGIFWSESVISKMAIRLFWRRGFQVIKYANGVQIIYYDQNGSSKVWIPEERISVIDLSEGDYVGDKGHQELP